MAIYSYEIGTTYGGMANLEDLTTPIPPPKSSFRPYSQYLSLGSGAVRGSGWPVAEWRWGYLSQAQRNQLRTFCTGASADIYVKTRKNDTSDAYQVYTAKMIWPEEEEKAHGKRLDFAIQFVDLVEYSP
jgi:hypothetical protein